MCFKFEVQHLCIFSTLIFYFKEPIPSITLFRYNHTFNFGNDFFVFWNNRVRFAETQSILDTYNLTYEYLLYSNNNYIPNKNYGYAPDRNDHLIKGTQHIFDGQTEIVLGKWLAFLYSWYANSG